MIPSPSAPDAAPTAADASPYDLAFLEPPPNPSQAKAEASSPPYDPALMAAGSCELYRQSAQEQAEHSGKRTFPWPVDVFLYPLNAAGTITLGMVIVIPMLINLVGGLLGPFGFFVLIPGTLLNAALGLYFLWYVAQCIRDSALGGVRAPETLAETPGLWEMLTQTARMLACIAVALLPMMIYWLSVMKVDGAFWSLLALAAAICPMALLAVTMFDSVGGLNPLILIGSVLSTLLPYLGLILIFGLMILLVIKAIEALSAHPLLGFVFGIAEMYLALVAAHLLGRFYWRYQEKLNWDV